MRIPICILAFALSSWAAEVPEKPADATAAVDTADQQAAPAPAPADAKPADATPPAPPPKYGGWVFSAMADAYVTHNGNNPSLDANQLQNFNIHSGDPRFSLGKFTIDKSDKVLGVHADIGVG